MHWLLTSLRRNRLTARTVTRWRRLSRRPLDLSLASNLAGWPPPSVSPWRHRRTGSSSPAGGGQRRGPVIRNRLSPTHSIVVLLWVACGPFECVGDSLFRLASTLALTAWLSSWTTN